MSPLSPTAAVELAYRRLRSAQSEAWITIVDEEVALEAARRLEAEGPAGRPLWGTTFAVKDNIDVAGLPTTAACPAFAYTPDAHAPAVARILAAGAVLVGKTNLDQFATGLVGTRSPYGTPHSTQDPARIAGGSSSGSAVAVAEGVVTFALGTDTAGSGRVPAAANAIIGLKPTLGLISGRGVVPACRSFDTVSIFARTLDEARAALAVVADADPEDPWSRPSPPLASGAEQRPALPSGRRLRLGVPRADSRSLCDDEAKAYEAAIAACETFAEIVEIDPAPLLAAGDLLYGGALVAERLTTVGELLRDQPDVVEPVVRAVVSRGLTLRAEEVFADLHRLGQLRIEAARLMADLDALLLPTIPDLPLLAQIDADPIGQNIALGRWTQFVNLLDLCAVTMPGAQRPDGLRGSVTVAAPAFADDLVAAVAGDLSAALAGSPTPDRRPTSVAAGAATDRVTIAVVGAHLKGLPLHHQLSDRGAAFAGTVRTAPSYRLVALPTEPPKPGMFRVATGGGSIEAELYELDLESFGSFVSEVPAPMVIGTVELEDGRSVKGFLAEPHATEGAEDITAHASWRDYIQR